MKTILHLFALMVFAILFQGISNHAFASHASGADMSVTCIGPNQYTVTVAFYRDCDGIDAPTSLTVDVESPSNCAGPTTVTLNQSNSCPNGGVSGSFATGLCPAQQLNSTCSGGNIDAVQVYYYCNTITLPAPCPDWVVGYSVCCRNSAITNLNSADSYDQYVYVTINNTTDPSTGQAYCNNSPVFSYGAVPFNCPGQPLTFNPGALDADGDSLVYSLINPLDAYGVPIPYNVGFSPNAPISGNNFSLDPQTGQITYYPIGYQVAAITLLVEEYRNGVLVGTTMRDIQFYMGATVQCSGAPPVIRLDQQSVSGGGLVDSATIQMCPNSTVTFTVTATDADGDGLTMQTNFAQFAGSSFSSTNITPDTIIGYFTWTPSVADTGFNNFTVRVIDDGCPYTQESFLPLKILVFDEVNVRPSRAVYCNDSIQLSAVGGSYFNWTPSTGLSADDIYNPKAAPAVPTMYVATSDCGADSVFVDVQPDFNLDLGNDTVVCLNSLVPITPSVDTRQGPYTFEWEPAAGLDDPFSQNPVASPRATTKYIATVTSNVGCIREDSITVNISGTAPNVTAFAIPDTVCPGEDAQLSLALAPTTCGLNVTPCSTPVDVYQMGTGTGSTIDATPFKGFYDDSRLQILYRASELNARGMDGSVISEIEFFISDKNSTSPYNNFTIKMGCTLIDQLTAFQPSLEIVYSPSAVNTSQGWNKFTLTNAYNWDGVSNLIIEICFDNADNTFTLDDEVLYSTTNYPCTVYGFEDQGTAGCNISSIRPGTKTRRPNTRFGTCLQPVTGATVSWSSPSLLDDASIPNPLATVNGTTDFIATVDDGICAGQGLVGVAVDTTVTLTAGPDTSLCLPTPLQLSATAVGTPAPIQLTCGANGTATTQPYATKIIGDLSPSGVTTVTTPFNGANADSRVQYLYTVNDLTNLGLSRGIIAEIAFHIAFKNSANMPFQNLTVKMGCTSMNALGSSFETGLDVVFNPKNYTTNTNWSNFVLDNPFDWDGLSNIIVEVCFDNPDFNYVNADIINYTTTSFNSVLHDAGDFGSGCSDLNNPTGSNLRPDIRLRVSDPPAGVFTYAWSPDIGLDDDSVQNPISNTSVTTTYTVTTTDGICKATDTVEVFFYTNYDINVFPSNVGCAGAGDGNIVSFPNGGVAPFDFVWNTGQTASSVVTDTLYNLTAGPYSVTVTDNNNCSNDTSVTITVPPPLTLSLVGRDISCNGYLDGQVEAINDGGTEPRSIAWSNGETTTIINNLAAGKYIATVTDGSGCTIVDSVTLTEPNPLIYNLNVTDASCYQFNDGEIGVNLSNGGSPPFTYNWSDGQDSSVAIDLAAAEYYLTITDDSNCMVFDTVRVDQPASFGVTLSPQDVNCYGGSDGVAQASVQGDTVNYSFQWNNDPNRTNAYGTGFSADTVTLRITDGTGQCYNDTFLVIDQPDEIILDVTSTDVTCNGIANGTATASVVSGGVPSYAYVWSSGSAGPAVSGLDTGIHIVTVTDGNFCEASDSVIISEPTPLSITIDNTVDVSCNGLADGELTASASGGASQYQYFWSDNQTGATATGLAAAINYQLTVTDANGCIDSLINIPVAEPTPVTFANLDVDSTCPGQSSGVILASASGGTGPYTFQLDSSSQSASGSFSGLPAGEYLVSIIDDNGCEIQTTVEVVAYDSVFVGFAEEIIEIALNEEVQLSPMIMPDDTSLYTVSWEPSTDLSCDNCFTTVASPSISTPYEISVTDDNQCTYTAVVTIEVQNELIVLIPNAFTPNGDGNNDILNVEGIALQSGSFQVYNRWGEKVFETFNITDRSQGWDGTYKGKALPPDVYVYYVDVTFEDGQTKQIKGSVTILK